MQPDRHVTGADFGMNGLTAGIAVYATGRETKCTNQKVVCRRNVFAHQDWNESHGLRNATKSDDRATDYLCFTVRELPG